MTSPTLLCNQLGENKETGMEVENYFFSEGSFKLFAFSFSMTVTLGGEPLKIVMPTQNAVSFFKTRQTSIWSMYMLLIPCINIL